MATTKLFSAFPPATRAQWEAVITKELKDKAGKPLGEEVYAAAKEGAIAEVSYMWPRPGQTDLVTKVAYVTRIGDQVCAVGYYK